MRNVEILLDEITLENNQVNLVNDLRNTQYTYLGWVSFPRFRNNCSLDDNRVSAQRARLKIGLNFDMYDSMEILSRVHALI